MTEPLTPRIEALEAAVQMLVQSLARLSIQGVERPDISLKGIERAALMEALHRSNQNQQEAAKMLGISERMICYKMDKFHLPRAYRNRKSHGRSNPPLECQT
jgi:DNA-binding NtrC family response regulator